MTTYYARNKSEILEKLSAKKEQRKEYNKSYYLKNKEQIDAKCVQRFEANKDKKRECMCGSLITVDYFNRHLKSDKHRDSICCGEICDCGMLIWFADDQYKLKRHIERPNHQAWLAKQDNIDLIPDTECGQCEDEQETILVLPDLILTDAEIEIPEDVIAKFEEERLKTNERANAYYHAHKNDENSSICKRREAHKETVRAYSKTENAKQLRYERDHRIETCVCGWKGLHGAKSRHKSQNQHIKFLELAQFQQQQ